MVASRQSRFRVAGLISIVSGYIKKRNKKRRLYVRKAHARSLDARFRNFDDYLLAKDAASFIEFVRLDPDEFFELRDRIAKHLSHRKTHRSPISVSERLALFLRWAGHGKSYTEAAGDFLMGISTVSEIIKEVSTAINKELFGDAFPELTAADLKRTSVDFQSKYDYPFAVGCIDGKHIAIRKPANSGSNYYNYKQFFSVVLMAIVDCEYRFMFFDIGSPGKNSDASVFGNSAIKSYLQQNDHIFPLDEDLPGEGRMSYHFLCDGGFGMTRRFIRPFTQSASRDDAKKRHFNEKLSGARRIVESAFGILAQRFAILSGPIPLPPEDVSAVVTSLLIIHNLVGRRQDALVNSNRFGTINRGQTHHQAAQGGNVTTQAKEMREKLVRYFALKDNVA